MSGAVDASVPSLTLGAAPDRSDVLVLGAGPAGSACARVLAQAGLAVTLVDARRFPRDKVCGDGLVPDALAALRRLGLHRDVMDHALALDRARCVAPSGGHVDVPGELAVIPRRVLDEDLLRGAIRAGSCFVAPAEFVVPACEGGAGRVQGAVLRADGLTRTLHARWVVLATGAAAGPLLAAEVCERRGANGFALRQYVRHPDLASELGGLRFFWHRTLRGGYGWIFPGPDGVCNIGVGILDDRVQGQGGGAAAQGPRLRELYARFTAADPLARRLLAEGEVLGPLKGAPLRCDLAGARLSRPGLLVIGEAAGSTYAFSGEGIGKAMETGIAAAEVLIEALRPQGSGAGADAATDDAAEPAAGAALQASLDAAVASAYAVRLDALRPRFDMYRKAVSFNRRPWLISLVVWRARHRPRVVQGLADILAERRLPGSLLSWRGLRAMWKA